MPNFRIAGGALVFCALLAVAPGSAAQTQEPGRVFPDRSPERYADIANFMRYDFAHWRRGYWMRDPRARSGVRWWWVVGDMWYPYDRVTYPYPDPYTPPTESQPAIIGRTFVADPSGPSPPYYWFYCEEVDTYYPYVTDCRSGWKAVRAPQP